MEPEGEGHYLPLCLENGLAYAPIRLPSYLPDRWECKSVTDLLVLGLFQSQGSGEEEPGVAARKGRCGFRDV